MRVESIKVMRRVLIGAIVLTLGALLFNYLQAWYRRSRQVAKPVQILAPEMKRAAKEVEYSEYRGDPRILRFKIHAKGLLEPEVGKSLLEGIEAYDFNPDGSVRNLIRSQRAEYDPDRKTADFFGDVRIFISNKTELRMNSLHYDLNQGIGSSPDTLQFHSEQVRGTARGVQYDQKRQWLDLHQDVNLTLELRQQAKGRGDPPRRMQAVAGRASYSETTGQILLEGKARIDSDLQVLSGDKIEAYADPIEKRFRMLTASGDAKYESKGSGDARTLEANRLVFGIGKSGILEKISLSGHALFSTKSSDEEQNLQGEEIDVSLDSAGEFPTQIQARTAVSFQTKRGKEQVAISGQQLDATFLSGTKYLESIIVRNGPEARGPAKIAMENADSAGSELQASEIRMGFRESGGRSVLQKLRAEGSAKYVSKPAKNGGGDPLPARFLSAALLELSQSGKGDFLESGSATGKVAIWEEIQTSSSRPQVKRLVADHATFRFFPEGGALKNLDADGHVQIAYEKKGSGKSISVERFSTTSDRMSAVFDLQAGKSVAKSVVQSGRFTYEDGTRKAAAGKCDYDAARGVLTLTEAPNISDETTATTGDRMEYDQSRKLLSVHGRVRSVIASGKGKGSFFGSSSSSSPGIVRADEMRYWTEDGRVRYFRNVHASSEGQNLTTDEMDISESFDRLEARGSVYHLLLPRESQKTSAEDKTKEKQTVAESQTTVRSSAMTYGRTKNQISYTGKVTLHSKDMDLASDKLDAVPDPDGKSLRQATALGAVVIKMGDRVCKGDMAQYQADSKTVVVTGNPAEVYDPSRGRSTARRLTSSTSDDTILLEN